MSGGECRRCGAAADGLVCGYCGSLSGAVGDHERQLEAVEEFHCLLRQQDKAGAVKLLRGGFIPSQKAALIEAGIRCIPLIDRTGLSTEPTISAIQRLEAVIAKLKVLPADDETRRAVAEFESKIARTDSRVRRVVLYGAALAALALVLALWFLPRGRRVPPARHPAVLPLKKRVLKPRSLPARRLRRAPGRGWSRTALPSAGRVSWSAVWGDFDSDGDLDLASTHEERGVLLLRNDGHGAFAASTLSGLDGKTYSLAWGDYDNDGLLDLALAQRYAENVVARNEGGGRFSQRTLAGTSGETMMMTWGDLDNDGDLDLVGTCWGGGYFIVRNDGAGRFTALPLEHLDGHPGPLACADYDNDGDLDFVINNGEGGDDFLARNEGDGRFSVIALAGSAGWTNAVGWADFDADGDLDFAAANGNGQSDFLFRNDGGGLFTKIVLPGTRGDSSSVAWGDFDADGDFDLAVTNANGQRQYLLRNDGKGSFSVGYLPDFSGDMRGLSWGDYDSDGDLDLALAGNAPSGDQLFTNESSARNSAPAAASSGLKASFSPYSASSSSGVLTLSWDAAADRETPAILLEYLVRVGTTSGGSEVLRIPARFSPDGLSGGGSFHYSTRISSGRRGIRLTVARGAVYHWAVVTVDSGFARSPESREQTAVAR